MQKGPLLFLLILLPESTSFITSPPPSSEVGDQAGGCPQMVVAGEHNGSSFIPLFQHYSISVHQHVCSEGLWLGFPICSPLLGQGVAARGTPKCIRGPPTTAEAVKGATLSDFARETPRCPPSVPLSPVTTSHW